MSTTDEAATVRNRARRADYDALPTKNATLWDLQSVRAERARRAAPGTVGLVGRCIRKFNAKVTGSGLSLVLAQLRADPPVLNEIALAVRGDDHSTYAGVIRLRDDGLANLVVDQHPGFAMRLLEQFDFT